ncbi:DR1-associated protein 1 (negative cofactor 2 alpha) [Kappamyces sp. JEL0829]|nr:DR1-associated protein 1 (negative cofactor 2 alpha) [Kappamyces sp. JEL0829]
MPPKAAFKTRIPAARIKRIMRTDDDVGKVAASTPVVIAKAIESFLAALVKQSLAETQERGAKKMTVSHVKKAVEADPKFDFLLDKVENIPDPQNDDGDKKARKPRKKKEVKEEGLVKEEVPADEA